MVALYSYWIDTIVAEDNADNDNEDSPDNEVNSVTVQRHHINWLTGLDWVDTIVAEGLQISGGLLHKLIQCLWAMSSSINEEGWTS